MALRQTEREAEVVDLVAKRGGLKLIDDVVALVLADRLQGPIEDVAQRSQLVRIQLPFAHCRFRDHALADLGDGRRIEAATHREALAVRRALAHPAVLENCERRRGEERGEKRCG